MKELIKQYFTRLWNNEGKRNYYINYNKKLYKIFTL